jgi:hypothetical protein
LRTARPIASSWSRRTVDHAMLARTYATQRFVVVAAGVAGLPAAALLVSRLSAAPALAAAGGFITCAAAIALCLQARRGPQSGCAPPRPVSRSYPR